ncbi:hypothetical protein HA402_008956 [Bradysia odoriphaga]|nr:hypothetical protein HA402_008956 [Bradysia odoriphaga]
MKFINDQGVTTSVAQSDTIGNINLIEDDYEAAVRGAMSETLNAAQLSSELTNKIGKNSQGFGYDLFAIDLQRSRDHGCTSYVEMRKLCNIQPEINSFDDYKKIFNETNVELLKSLYASYEDVDFYVGGLLEMFENIGVAIVGPTFGCIIGLGHNNYVQGDIYYYTHKQSPHPFSAAQLASLAVVVSLPLELPSGRSAFLSYNFETNYYYAYFDNAAGLVPLPFSHILEPGTNLGTKHRIELSPAYRQFGESAGLSSESVNKTEQSATLTNSTVDGESKSETILTLESIDPKKSGKKQKKVDDKEKLKNRQLRSLLQNYFMSRRRFFKMMESKMDSSGLNGNECLLKAICETAAHSFGQHNGVIGSVVDILFLPSASKDEKLPKRYYKAEHNGKLRNCDSYNNMCPTEGAALLSYASYGCSLECTFDLLNLTSIKQLPSGLSYRLNHTTNNSNKQNLPKRPIKLRSIIDNQIKELAECKAATKQIIVGKMKDLEESRLAGREKERFRQTLTNDLKEVDVELMNQWVVERIAENWKKKQF